MHSSADPKRVGLHLPTRFARWHKVALCAAVIAGGIPLAAEDWPEWRGRSRAGVWNESGVIDTFPSGGLTAGWRTPIHAGYAGPAVAGGRVFVTDSRRIKANQAIERAVALDEQSGRVLWTHEWETNYSGLQLVYAIGPRATPTVDDDRVYVLGAMGRLFALDVKSGRVLWEKDYVADFNASVPTWGMAGAPLVDGDLLICLVGGEPDGKVIALDKRTGKEVWRALSSNTEPGYNQPIIINAGGTRQLILFHPEGFSALDPATGKVFWEIEHRVQMGIVVATPVHSGRYLFFTSQHGGARMLALDEHKPAAAILWSGPGEQDPGMTHDTPDTVNSVIGTPRHRRRVRLRPGQRRPAAMSERSDRQAGLEDRCAARRARHVRDGVLRQERRPLLHQQRSRRAGHRTALAQGIRGNQPDQADRADAPVRPPASAPQRALVARRVRQPARHRPERQRDRQLFAGRRTLKCRRASSGLASRLPGR